MPDDAPSARPRPAAAGHVVAAVVLLAIPCVALLLVPIYSRETPTLWGFPFFYWYQVLWVFITPALTYARLPDHRARAGRASERPGAGSGRQRRRARRRAVLLRRSSRSAASSPRGGDAAEHWTAWTSGGWAGAASARWSPGSCSAATSTPPTPSSRCRRRCSRTGAVSGFFAVPYTIVVVPDRSSSSCRGCGRRAPHGYVTPADFVRGRYDSRVLGAGRRAHRHPRDDALHRPAAGRHPGRPRHDGPRRLGQRVRRATCR